MVKSIFAVVLSVSVAGCESAAMVEPSETASFQPTLTSPPADRGRRDNGDRDGFALGGKLVNGLSTNLGQSSAALADPPATIDVIQRQVIYSASLRLVVVSTLDAMNAVQSFAKDAGGYLQESDANSITIRVPAAKFDDAVKRIATLGEVVDRNVKASDVTEQFQDLQIRLDNAKKALSRLNDHLAKSEKIEDTIKIEMEIARVTDVIETLEGKMRFMQSQIAMSTIRVEVNSLQPKSNGGPKAATPFDWIDRLGDGLVAGNVEAMPRQPKIFAGGPKFDPPAGFVRYYSSPNLVEAMDADGVRIKLQRQPNFDKGPIEFWQKLARKSLVEGRAVAVTKEGALDGDASWMQIVGTREVSGQTFGYVLAVSRTNDYVYTFESWAPKASFDAKLPAIIASAKTLKR